MFSECFKIRSQGEKLYGVVYLPSNSIRIKRKYPGVCVASSGAGPSYLKDDGTLSEGRIKIAEELANAGFASLVYAARGQPFEAIKKKSGGGRSHAHMLEDLGAVIDWLASPKYVDGKRIGIFGQCAGGAAAIYLSLTHDLVSSIVTYGTATRYSRYYEYPNRFVEHTSLLKSKGAVVDLRTEYLKFDIDSIAHLVRKPLLIIGGTKDQKYFNQKDQKNMFEKIISTKRKDFIVIEGATHTPEPFDPYFPKLLQLLINWFQGTLV